MWPVTRVGAHTVTATLVVVTTKLFLKIRKGPGSLRVKKKYQLLLKKNLVI